MANPNGLDPQFLGSVGVARQIKVPQTGVATLLNLGSSNFVVQVGSGLPTNVATKCTIHLNTTGSGTTDRVYINTTGASAWTSITTAA